MRDAIYILAGMALMALLGMGGAHADSKQELTARIAKLKDRAIYEQREKCPQHPRSGECSTRATEVIQKLDTLNEDNETFGFGEYGSEDPGVRFALKQRLNECVRLLYELREDFPAP